MQKGYTEIVKSCLLVDYREELAGKHSIWAEYWVDETKQYRAIFTNQQVSFFPHTIYTDHLDEIS